jgi:hypothetical protein
MFNSHSLKEIANHIYHLLNFQPAICVIFNKLPLLAAAFALLLLNETGRSSVLQKGVICAYI